MMHEEDVRKSDYHGEKSLVITRDLLDQTEQHYTELSLKNAGRDNIFMNKILHACVL